MLHLLTSTKTNMDALELMRHMRVNYKSAWRVKHKIMRAMLERKEPRRLEGSVQMDDAYLGGEHNGAKPGRGSENKQPFVIDVETDEDLERPRFAVTEPVKSFDNDSLQDWATRRSAPEAVAYTGGLGRFSPHRRSRPRADRMETGGDRAATKARGARWVNIVLSNLSARSMAFIMPFGRPRTRVVTSPRPPTASTTPFACERCCRGWLSR